MLLDHHSRIRVLCPWLTRIVAFADLQLHLFYPPSFSTGFP